MEKNRFDITVYDANNCCVFKKTKELFGGLSNMASGFPLKINGHIILTSEALYQACRFPHLSDLQKKIISEKSPMSAKMISKTYKQMTRPDWDEVRVDIMRWCLQIKLAQNYIKFGEVLSSTKHLPIVEESTRDKFWGAIRDKNNLSILEGSNILGRLLYEIRNVYYDNLNSLNLISIVPPPIAKFTFLGESINAIEYIPFKEANNYQNDTIKFNQNGIQGKFDF